MRKQWPLVLAGFALILVPGAYLAYEQLKDTRLRTEPYDDVYELLYQHDPEWVSTYRPNFLVEGRATSIAMTDRSPAGLARWRENLELAQRTLSAMSVVPQDPLLQLRHRAVVQYVDRQVRKAKWALYEYPLDPVEGLHVRLPIQLAFLQSAPDKDQAEYYLTRLKEYPKLVEQVRARLDAMAKAGLLPPRQILETSLAQLNSLRQIPSKDRILYRHLAYQLAQADPLDMNETQALYYLQSAQRFIETYVNPGLTDLARAVQSLLPQADTVISVKRLPAGSEWWASTVQAYTSQPDPLSLHEMGLAAMVDLQAKDSSQQSLLVREPPPPHTSVDSLRKKVRQITGWTIAMQDYAYGLLDSVPIVPIDIQPMPREAGVLTPAAMYFGPALDGTRPGFLLADLMSPEYQPLDAYRLAFYQAGIPGEHFLQAARLVQTDLPEIFQAMQWEALQKGWSLYTADLIVPELGLLYGEPVAFATFFQQKRLALARLIVDTGIHGKDWSEAAAVAYFQKEAFLSLRQARYEVAQIICFPGRGCADWLGYQALRSLRNRMETKLKDAFLLQQFHQQVLENAYLPLPLLRECLEYLPYGKLAS